MQVVSERPAYICLYITIRKLIERNSQNIPFSSNKKGLRHFAFLYGKWVDNSKMTTVTIAYLAVYVTNNTIAVQNSRSCEPNTLLALFPRSVASIYVRAGQHTHTHTRAHCLDFVNHQRSPSLVLFLNVLRLDFCRLGDDRWSGTSRASVRPGPAVLQVLHLTIKTKNDDPAPSIPWLCLSGRRTTARIKRSGYSHDISGSGSSSAHPHRSCYMGHMC